MQSACAILSSVACPTLNIFRHYLINGTIFGGGELLNMKCVLIFSTTFVWYTSHSMKNWTRNDPQSILVFMRSSCYFCQILMKLEFSRLIFEKYSNINFNENPSSGRHAVPCEQTNETPLLVALLYFANATKKDVWGKNWRHHIRWFISVRKSAECCTWAHCWLKQMLGTPCCETQHREERLVPLGQVEELNRRFRAMIKKFKELCANFGYIEIFIKKKVSYYIWLDMTRYLMS